MIVRKPGNGELLLIGQTDHSKLVGQLAASWGNDEFAVPDPYDSMVRAAGFHDYGWLRYETSPLIHDETGEPYGFQNLPFSRSQLESYQWSLDWMADIDRYSGLIMNMHRTGLWRDRYGMITYPKGYNPPQTGSEIQEFVRRNEAWQETERPLWNLDQLWINYRLMQVWDLLGLYFCCHDLCEDYIEPVPTSYSRPKNVRLTMKPAGPGQVEFDPYPFSQRPCRLQLNFKQLPQSSFEDLEAFRRAYFQAPNDLMRFDLI